MAITVNHLTSGGVGSAASSYNTASISPTANRLVVVDVVNFRAGGATLPTVSGASMTWAQVGTYLRSSTTARVTCFAALAASPGSGALTIAFGGTNQDNCGWSITEFIDVETSGTNGANAYRNFVGGEVAANNTSLTINLAAFASTNNATHGYIRVGASVANITPGSGFSELSEVNTTGASVESQWRNDNDTSVDWSYANSAGVSIGFGLEIVAPIVVTSRRLALLGVGP